jgi:hypothetical protein
VDVLDDEISGGQQPMTGRNCEHRRVVTDSDLHAGIPGRDPGPPDAADQPALAQSAKTHPFGWL